MDNFAGGGGASTGLEWALQRSPDLAVNHDPKAIAMHKANHPGTRHFCEDVFAISPREVVGSRGIGLAWFSPDCTYFSKARGAKPFRDRDAARRRRGLAGVVIRWASLRKPKKPRVILMENVEEFQDWGPLDANGLPDPLRKGLSFRRWLSQLRNCGFEVEVRQLVACDYGSPTKRKRLFVIARSDGRPIVWPRPTHGPGLEPHRSAAECMDWALPVHSIFMRPTEARKYGVHRPLADKTLRRIARGVFRYVIEAAEPFIVPVAHAGDLRVHSIRRPMPTVTGAHRGEHALVAPFLDRYYSERQPYVRGGKAITEPLPTVTSWDHHSLVAPTLIQSGWGERKGQRPRALNIQEPLGTVMADGVKHALVAAFLAKHYGGHENDGAPMQLSMPTVTARDHHALVTSHLLKLKGTCVDGQPVTRPMPTVQAQGTHLAEVRAFLIKYYGTEQDPQMRMPLGTVTTKDRFGLVTVHGEDYAIGDIGMRMLSPRELFRAQGFRDSYQIEVPYAGGRLTKSDQVALCGNSVNPDVAQWLAIANLSDNPVGLEGVA